MIDDGPRNLANEETALRIARTQINNPNQRRFQIPKHIINFYLNKQ